MSHLFINLSFFFVNFVLFLTRFLLFYQGKSQKGKRSSKSGSKATRPRRGIHSGANRTPLSLVRIKQMSEQYIHNELYLDEEPRRECIIPKEEEGELCQNPVRID